MSTTSGLAVVIPSKPFVMIDEHADSINDMDFCVAMAAPNAATGLIVDFSASFHANAAGISFADGQSEIHCWHGSKIQPPLLGIT